MAVDREMWKSFIEWCQQRIAAERTVLAPLEMGERRTAVSGPNTDFDWLETTQDDVERLRHDIAYLEAVVDKYKHNVE
jgi:hypothetical protein